MRSDNDCTLRERIGLEMNLPNTLDDPIGIDLDQVETHRILVIDDNHNIHNDFMKILMPDYYDDTVSELEEEMFGESQNNINNKIKFDLICAGQGQEGCQLIEQANVAGEPYSVVFVDMRMPPGWDGLQTIKEIIKIDKNIQIVLCTAYSDYTWAEIIKELKEAEHLLILKKPFDRLEVWQMACCLSQKWLLDIQTKEKVALLEKSYDIIAKTNEDFRVAIENSEIAVQKKKMAVEAKGKFLANMTHEIRTPMTAILGFSEMLCEDSLLSQFSQAHKPFVKNIHGSCEHLLTVINDILDLSKIEVGKMNIEALKCSPFEIVTQLKDEYVASARAKQLDLSIAYQFPIAETITTDSMRIKQVLSNLLSNAIKFTDKGHVTLSVGMVNLSTDNPLIQFEVIDSGIGLTDEKVEQLFQPFVQGDTSTTRNYGGTGLGLTISKHLAEIMGGDISVEKNPEIGSTFRVRISAGDLSDTLMVNSEDETTVVVAMNEVIREKEGNLVANILLVEDCPDNRELISFIINAAGADLAFAVNGKEAVDMVLAQEAAGTPYDIVLMDMQMPVMDGYEATAILRDRGIKTTIIALTAHNMVSECKKCFDAGCDNLLSKPIDRSKFIPTLASYLAKGKEAIAHLAQQSENQIETVAQEVVADATSPEIVLSDFDKDIDFADLLDSFCEKLPERIAKIENAIDAQDFEALKEAAHQIKGTSGNYGFMVISEAAKLLEAAAIESDLDGSTTHQKILTNICHGAMRGRNIAISSADGGNTASPAVPLDIQDNAAAAKKPLITVAVIKDDRKDLLVSDKSALIVSNDEAVSAMLFEICRENQMKCLHANTCMIGEKLTETYLPDAVFIDIGMASAKEFDLLGHIKRNSKLRFTPVHIFDTNGNDGESIEYLQNFILYKASLFIHREIGAAPESKRKIIAAQDNCDTILKGKRALIVDDIKINRKMLSKVLERHDMEIVMAVNGQEALHILKEDKKIDLVLMDIMMPIMDGYETMRCIREDDHYKDISMMALTAKAMAEDRERCISAGADDYMPKPIQTDELINTLQVWLYKAQ